MKKYILTIIALATLWSCQTDEAYERLNRDPKNPTQVRADFLFTSATVSLGDQMASPNVNLNIFRFIAQYLTATTYLDEPNYDLNNRNIPQNHWTILYRNVIFNLQDAKAIVMENAELSEGAKRARIGQIEVIEVYAWHVLVDSFGDIPYTEALDADISLPKYDDDAAIYDDLLNRLSAVIADLEAGQGFTGADVIYGGDMDAWVKFANSLRLRLAMRISDVDAAKSKTHANAAIAGGVFTSNDDNALIEYQSSPPNTNPLWSDLVQSGRSDYVAANTIVDIMNDLGDPRRDEYFRQNLGAGVYEGGIYGGSNSFPLYSHAGDAFHDPTHPGILLDWSEVEFNLAEAAKIGGYNTPMDAKGHYEEGIRASILYWGGTEAEVTAYLAKAGVAYDGSEEQLGTQFWIAMYDNPFQGWAVWRKFDAPTFNLPEDSGNPVPLRYTYPVNEQNLNVDNYNDASSAIGGDDQQTQVFWDVD